MMHFEPKDLPQPEVHRILLGGVGPRPIALVSSLSEDGIPNLTPFSFFNAFGSNPPIIVFSPSRRGRDSSLKDTYNNLIKTKECVVQSVTYQIVEQVSVASGEYPSEVNEFEKSGLTPVDSDIVKPKRVKESPFQMECRVLEIKSFGNGGGSANLVICEVLKFHVAEDIFKDGIIHPDLIDLVARMSGSFYTRAKGDSIFELPQPGRNVGLGFDTLPDFIKESNIYSANNLGKFASYKKIPSDDEVKIFINEIMESESKNFESSIEAFYRFKEQKNYRYMLKAALILSKENNSSSKLLIELSAKCALEKNDILFAWKTALYAGKMKNM